MSKAKFVLSEATVALDIEAALLVKELLKNFAIHTHHAKA